ncbi:hypothetical protein [Pseudomonas lopnurensis]|uniref:hypothetical protein n=1 Tax=Pseudomonas lopnurensis TaxID=1477517 RepID=UPI0028B1B446|nr:hypothetical protein [Pseudomonas lopnurensis]
MLLKVVDWSRVEVCGFLAKTAFVRASCPAPESFGSSVAPLFAARSLKSRDAQPIVKMLADTAPVRLRKRSIFRGFNNKAPPSLTSSG